MEHDVIKDVGCCNPPGSEHGYGELEPSFGLEGGRFEYNAVLLNFSHRIQAVEVPRRLAILALDLEGFRSCDV